MIKVTEMEVKANIRDIGKWEGYIVGNKVNPWHLTDGCLLGTYVTFTTLEEMEKEINSALYYLRPEHGTGIAFYVGDAGGITNMLNKNDLDRLWLRLCDLQDCLSEEGRTAMYWDVQTVMDHVDYLSRNLEEQKKEETK